MMTNDALLDALLTAERCLQAAQLASDVSMLEELLDERLLFTGPDGALLSKADDLAAHRTGYQVLHRLQEEDLRASVTGSTGLTWFLGTLEGRLGDQPVTARIRYTRTWHHDESEGWKLLAAHASALGPGPAS